VLLDADGRELALAEQGGTVADQSVPGRRAPGRRTLKSAADAGLRRREIRRRRVPSIGLLSWPRDVARAVVFL
jgi:hypothetical protein